MMAAPMRSFIFGQGQEYSSPEELAKARALAEAMLGPQRAPQNVGEGLTALGYAIRGRMDMGKINKAEAAGRASAGESISRALGRQGPFPAAPTGNSVANALSPTSVPQSANAAAIRAGLVKRGLPEHVADGFLMNFQDESGLNPGINEKAPLVPGSRGGFGLYQLTGPRRIAYEKFAADRGVAPSDTDAQLDFLMTELQGPEAKAAQSIMGSKDAGSAAAAIARDFLRPSKDHLDRRVARYTQGQPVQVASNDPTVGVAQALNRQDINPQAAGQPIATDAPTQRVLGQMMQPQSMTGGAPMPIQGQPQQVAQAQPQDLSQIPVMAGGTSGAIDPNQGPDLNTLLEAARNPWLNEQERGLVNTLLEQKMKQSDPANQLDMDYKRAQLQALKNPIEKPTDDMREYEFAKKQGFPGSFVDFQLAQKKAGATNVNTTVGGNTSEFVKKSDEAAAKRMDEIVQAGQSAPQTLSDMQQLIDLGAQIGTGKGAQIMATIGPYAQALGIDIKNMNEIQAYEAITSRLAPQMRAVGSGASSDRDVSMFLQSLPNLRNVQGGNEIIANTMKAVAQNKINAAEIASKAQRGEISWQDADKQIRELPNPYELFKGFQKQTQDSKKTVIDGYTIEEVE